MTEPQLSAEQLQLVTEWWDKNYLDFGIGNNSTKLGLIIGLLATALEEEREKVLEEVDKAVTKRVLPAPLLGHYTEDKLHQRWQVELNQLKGNHD